MNCLHTYYSHIHHCPKTLFRLRSLQELEHFPAVLFILKLSLGYLTFDQCRSWMNEILMYDSSPHCTSGMCNSTHLNISTLRMAKDLSIRVPEEEAPWALGKTSCAMLGLHTGGNCRACGWQARKTSSNPCTGIYPRPYPASQVVHGLCLWILVFRQPLGTALSLLWVPGLSPLPPIYSSSGTAGASPFLLQHS